MLSPARVYPITDTRLSGLTHAEQVARLVRGGATLIQLREKHLPPSAFFEQAEQAIAVAHANGARIIINDRVDIAIALAADGVHLGQDDMPPAAARALLGDQALIGFSTHNLPQALQARDLPIDYLAVGPIFQTATKANPEPRHRVSRPNGNPRGHRGVSTGGDRRHYGFECKDYARGRG